MSTRVGAQAARYLADIAEALKPLTDRDCDGLNLYISEVRIGFEGEDMGYRIAADEFGGLSIELPDGGAE